VGDFESPKGTIFDPGWSLLIRPVTPASLQFASGLRCDMSPYHMTILSQEIKRLRLQKKWNQTEAAKQCGINPSIFSRMESGKIERPTAETISKLAEGFGISIQFLDSLIPKIDDKLKIGFSHSLWAAPIIALLMEGPPFKGIRLTSYGKYQAADSFEYHPHWYQAETKGPVLVGPRFRRTKSDLAPGFSYHSADSFHSPYYAPDLDRLLQNQELDCVIATKQVFSDHDSMLLPCAMIMDCAFGEEELLVWNQKSDFAKVFSDVPELSPLSRLHMAKKLKRQRKKLSVFYGRGTSAEKTAEALVEFPIEKRPLVLRDWLPALHEMQRIYNDEGAFLLIGWEPLNSWVQSSGKFSSVQKTLKTHSGIEGPIPYLTFDVMFSRKNAAKWIQSDSVTELLKQLYLHVQRLNAAVTAQKSDATIVKQIACYLDMDAQACLDGLSRIHFGLWFYREWLEYKDGVLT
jgi:transcriptional regulator with XRE-family HTH domain